MDALEVITSPNDVTVLVLRGEHDLRGASELRRELYALVRSGGPVVVDVSEVTFLDSTVLHTLLGADELAREAGHPLTLQLGTPPTIRNVLRVAGVMERLVCADSRGAALELARNGRAPDVSTQALP